MWSGRATRRPTGITETSTSSRPERTKWCASSSTTRTGWRWRSRSGWAPGPRGGPWRLRRWPERADLVTTIVAARARQAQSRQHPDVDAVDWFTRTEALGLLRAGHGFDAVTIAVLHWWLTEGRSA
jgi:hypothetical protein